MKRISYLLFCCMSLIMGYAQDTLVTNQGVMISANILKMDSTTISFIIADTPQGETSVLYKSQLLLAKFKDGSVEKYYKDDTLVGLNGQLWPCKILEIESELFTYFKYEGRIENPIMASKDVYSEFRFSNGTKEVYYVPKITSVEYQEMGKTDAYSYFETSKITKTVSTVSGVLWWIPIYPILACTAPKNLDNISNPNNHLLQTNGSYYLGFKKQAKKTKVKDVSKSFLLGMAVVPTVILGIAALVLAVL